MPAHNSYSFLAVTMTIYEPGFTYRSLEDRPFPDMEVEDWHDLWVTPDWEKEYRGDERNYYLTDCLAPYPRKTMWAYEHDMQFVKWAVGFDFKEIGTHVTRGDNELGVLTWWIQDGGVDQLKPYLDALIELADPLVFAAARSPVAYDDLRYAYTISFVTAWTIDCPKYNPDDDCDYILLGRVDMKHAPIIPAEPEQVSERSR